MAAVSEPQSDAVIRSGRLSQPLPEGPRRWLDRAIYGAAAIFIVVGLWFTAGRSWIFAQGARYEAAQAAHSHCATYAETLARTDCILTVPATVTSTQQPAHGGAIDARVTLTAPSLSATPLSFAAPQPSVFFYSLTPNQSVYLWIWQGRAANVCNNEVLGPCGGFRLADSPVLFDRMYLASGLFALGMGGVLFLIHPPLRLRTLLAASPLLNRPGDEPAGTIAVLLRQRVLGAAFVVFIGLSVMDIVTSIWDGNVGFYESNPLAVQVNSALGEVAGFLAIKAPAVIALALGAARLPRRIATLVLLAGVLVYVYIVAQNIALHYTGQPTG